MNLVNKGVVMEFLKSIGIKSINSGAQLGHGWQSSSSANSITSMSPINGESISVVNSCSEQDYQTVMAGRAKGFFRMA